MFSILKIHLQGKKFYIAINMIALILLIILFLKIYFEDQHVAHGGVK